MLRGLLQQARWKCSGHAVEAHHQQMSTAQSAGGNTSSATCIDVQRFLRAHGVDVSRFQRPVHDLQLEADRAEAHFELDPSTGRPVRYIEVVRLLIRAQETGLYLIERHQRFSDGLQRSRNIAPSEKLLQGEALEQAARRALAEELSHAASTSARLFTDDSLHSTTKKIQSSRSCVLLILVSLSAYLFPRMHQPLQFALLLQVSRAHNELLVP